jgi:hypothetical protein
VSGTGRLVLGGCKIARKGEVESGGSSSWGETEMLVTGGVGDCGAVGTTPREETTTTGQQHNTRQKWVQQ